MKRFLCAFLAVSATVLAQLPNGEVAGAIAIGVGINPGAPSGASGNTFSNAGEADLLSTGLPAMCGSGANSDVFFSFTATNAALYSFETCFPTGSGFAVGTHADTILQILDATLLTSLGCNDDACSPGFGTSNFNSRVTLSLTAGQSVYVRIASWSGATDGSFYLTATEILPPANDDCSGAISLAVGPNAGNTLLATFSAGDPVGTCASITGTSLDVWYTFTTGIPCTVILGRTGTGANQMGLYSGSCGTLASVACGTTSITSVVAAGTYYVRVAQTVAASANEFTLSFDCVQPPANDACGTAEVVTDGVLINGTTAAANPTNPSPAGCTSFSITSPDVWYSYTPATSGTVRITRAGTGASRMAAYTGACGAEVYALSSCGTNLTVVFDVVAGTTYLIRVGVLGATSTVGAFTLFIEAPVAQTSSDICASALPLAIGMNAGTTVLATASNPSPVCTSFSTTAPDVWYTFSPVVSCAANLTRSSDGEGVTRLAVYEGADCLTLLPTGTTCSTGTTITWPAFAGTTYYIRAGVFSVSTTGPFLLNLACLPYEPNDSCSGAVAIVDGLNGPFDNTGTLAGLAAGFTPMCASASRDLFYTYTPACDGTLNINTCAAGTLNDTVLAAYSMWTCAGPNTATACNDDSACIVSGTRSTITFPVTAGTTYLVQVAGFGSGIGTFSLNVTLSTAQIAVIGTGCGTPAATLAGSGPPVMGSTGTISVTAQPFANGLLLFSNPNLAMAYTPFGACTIYLENPGMGILLPIFTDALGAWSLTATFPMDPALNCVGWDFQALVIGGAGIEFSNALRLILGT